MNKEYLIRKWLADELTDAEMEAFKKLDDYKMHIKILENAQYFKAPDINYLETENIIAKRLVIKKSTSSYKSILKIAVLLALVLGVLSIFFINNTIATTVQTAVSEKRTITLPDASIATINSKTEISFNKEDWNSNREVNLDGEAFFKVKKGSQFNVLTDIGKITVLGTQFNVKNRDNYFEVQCYEGLVRVEYNNKFIKDLSAGSIFKIIDGATSFETTKEGNPSWTNNISRFKSVPYDEVIKEFERQYNVTFNIDNIDSRRLFTGGFIHTNLQYGLKSITLPLDLTYTIVDDSNHIILRKIE
ncbi:FecR family protein [Aquimarina longa]|uniref:FecR family protein n=1 Tax=Aquimarina longa TaxID=1080221 RepID=UPI000780DFF0|nr:FecR family protein [Aquimarina longa]